jgi:hypothetical protein
MRASRRDIDPRLGLLDFSGYVDAQRIRSQGMQQLGQNIGDAIRGFQENKKLDKKVGQLADYFTKGIENKTVSPRFFDFIGIDASELKGKSSDVIKSSILEGLNNYGKKESAELHSLLQLKQLEKSLKKSSFEKKEEEIAEVVQNPEYRELLDKHPVYGQMEDDDLTRTLVLRDQDIFDTGSALDFLLDQGEDDIEVIDIY